MSRGEEISLHTRGTEESVLLTCAVWVLLGASFTGAFVSTSYSYLKVLCEINRVVHTKTILSANLKRRYLRAF